MLERTLPYITNDALNDRDVGKRVGFWDPISPEEHDKRIFYEFFRRNEDEKILANVLNYFSAVRDRWPDAWESTGKGAILTRTNGFNGLIRFLRPAYLNFTTEPKVVTKDRFLSLFRKMKLSDDDFNADNFVPGGSGSTKLYRTLLEQSNI